jgi:hypothetical protein
MHDVIRSFAQYVARNEALVAQNKEIDIADKINPQEFIRLSLETRGSESDELEWYSLQAQTSLRTLMSHGDIKNQDRGFIACFFKFKDTTCTRCKC